MKAILTKYHGPTDTKSARISARAEGVGRVTVSYDYSGNQEECHLAAAKALCAKYGWTGELVGGGLPDQTGYAFVFVNGADR